MRPSTSKPTLRLPLLLAAIAAMALPTVHADETAHASASDVALAACGITIGSSPATLWTAEDPTGTSGIRQPSVVQPAATSWFDIPGGSYIWKADSVPPQPSLLLPVTFEREFLGCGTLPTQGRLVINGDNAYEAYFNGVLVAQCGTAQVSISQNCFSAGRENVATVNVLPAGNALVVLAWNHAATTGGLVGPSPAMIQYTITF